MKKVNNMRELKEFAFGITEATEVVYPQFGKKDVVNPIEKGRLENKYCVNNGIMSFVSEGIMYVVPYTEKALQILLKENFQCDGVYVPFSNWDYPVKELKKWEDIKARSMIQRGIEQA